MKGIHHQASKYILLAWWWYAHNQLQRLRQEDYKFETSLGYTVRSCLYKRKNTGNGGWGEKSLFRETAMSKQFRVGESVVGVYSLLLPVRRDLVFRDAACMDATMICFSLNLNVTPYFLGFCFFFFQDKASNIVAKNDLELLILEFPAPQSSD